jgi:hypothetical protein
MTESMPHPSARKEVGRFPKAGPEQEARRCPDGVEIIHPNVPSVLCQTEPSLAEMNLQFPKIE